MADSYFRLGTDIVLATDEINFIRRYGKEIQVGLKNKEDPITVSFKTIKESEGFFEDLITNLFEEDDES